jgi:hypothetical protein
LRQADFYLMKWLAWFLCFYVSANLLTGYEAIMNALGHAAPTYGQLTGAAAITVYGDTTNLFTEGPVGYAILALIAVSAAMFLREMLRFQKEVRSLSNSESLTLSPEVKT